MRAHQERPRHKALRLRLKPGADAAAQLNAAHASNPLQRALHLHEEQTGCIDVTKAGRQSDKVAQCAFPLPCDSATWAPVPLHMAMSQNLSSHLSPSALPMLRTLSAHVPDRHGSCQVGPGQCGHVDGAVKEQLRRYPVAEHDVVVDHWADDGVPEGGPAQQRLRQAAWPSCCSSSHPCPPACAMPAGQDSEPRPAASMACLCRLSEGRQPGVTARSATPHCIWTRFSVKVAWQCHALWSPKHQAHPLPALQQHQTPCTCSR